MEAKLKPNFRPKRARARFDAANLQAAEVLLADVPKYGGEQSGAVQWAQAVMRRLGHHPAADAGPLFADQFGAGGRLPDGGAQLLCASTASGDILDSPRHATATQRSIDR
jgi:hypothetical protein